MHPATSPGPGPTPVECVLGTDVSRPVAIAEASEFVTLIHSLPRPATDWRGMLKFHLRAAADPNRPPELRRWHRRAAAGLRQRIRTRQPNAWDWQEMCRIWRSAGTAGGTPLT
jgi:hypothetical protein